MKVSTGTVNAITVAWQVMACGLLLKPVQS